MPAAPRSPKDPRRRPPLRSALVSPATAGIGLGLLVLAFVAYLQSPSARTERLYGSVIHETRSGFSHIRIREKGTVRSLLFVDEHGHEQCQSSIDLANPGVPRLKYTRTILAAMLFVEEPRTALVVGLGAGGMIRFHQVHFPEIQVEALEIDPVVVDLAGQWFGTQPGPGVRIHTVDAFDFFRDSQSDYDIIYMDAFLRPKGRADLDEKTRRLRTGKFLKGLGDHLRPGGVIAINLIESDPEFSANLAAIRDSFATVHRFDVPGTGNLVVIATPDAREIPSDVPRARAEELDRRGGPFRFQAILEQRLP